MLTPVEGRPLLSVVITVVEGGAALERTLDALAAQEDAPSMEVLVPLDATMASHAPLTDPYPWARTVDLGEIATGRPTGTPAGQHELFDHRRAAGLREARGDIVAMIEDRGSPAPDWARALMEEHRARGAVVGGAIEPATTDRLRWALWVCDFGRYGLPFDGGAREWVTDVNVSYKREALEATRELWAERYSEPILHWALQERGETLFLSPRPVVAYRRAPTTLAEVVPERFHWGRLFGSIRATRMGLAKRLVFVAAGPIIPARVFLRHAATQRRKGRGLLFLAAAPATFALLVAWTAGEIVGYLTARP